ncbi:MAG: DNA-binding protein [Oscillospiraceae bacterium]|nr:DNA-binding protein [Oscillospiraceae bacterium]
MSDGPLELALLFDFFGDLLTDTQREYFDLYYNDDMSLAEVAELKGVSRPAVLDAVKKAKSAMRRLEDKTGVVKRFTEMRLGLMELQRKVSELAAALPEGAEMRLAQEIVNDIEELKNGI